MGYEYWNSLKKDEQTVSVAGPNDIVEEIDGVAFLCQTHNDSNNVICIATDGTNSIKHVRAMFKFMIMLLDIYQIEYVRVEGSTDRYNFLEKIFNTDEVLRDRRITHRNVFYCNLNAALPKLKKLIKKEGN